MSIKLCRRAAAAHNTSNLHNVQSIYTLISQHIVGRNFVNYLDRRYNLFSHLSSDMAVGIGMLLTSSGPDCPHSTINYPAASQCGAAAVIIIDITQCSPGLFMRDWGRIDGLGWGDTYNNSNKLATSHCSTARWPHWIPTN